MSTEAALFLNWDDGMIYPSLLWNWAFVDIVTNYATIVVPGIAGLGLFAVLRRLAVRPSVAGILAILTALLVMVVIFAAIILTGSY